jgi:hypothetical protein
LTEIDGNEGEAMTGGASPASRYNVALADPQATTVEPVEPSRFDAAAYGEYAADLAERCRAFWSSDCGVAVYRRFRAAGVFGGACADMRRSLALQLGALQASMAYKADIPNFLEPWYGIGAAASALGASYVWPGNAAPANGCRPSSTVGISKTPGK